MITALRPTSHVSTKWIYLSILSISKKEAYVETSVGSETGSAPARFYYLICLSQKS